MHTSRDFDYKPLELVIAQQAFRNKQLLCNKACCSTSVDEVSGANRMKRKESEERTALRKAAAAAAAVEKKQAEQQRASLREKLAEQPMCVRRQLGSQRIADKATAVAAAPAAAAAPEATAQPQKGTQRTASL